jgi:DNA-binding CsgD family transcriptional regulator/tetratricopeptide (TPR) repeat protein
MRSGEAVVHGRSLECAEIDTVIDKVRSAAGASLMLIGDTGLGKTTLLRYAAERAEGVRVLAARGVPAETGLPFAGLHGLLRPVLDLLPHIPTRQNAALSAGLALSPEPTDDVFAVAAGTLNLLAAAAAAGGMPVLVVVDDVHMWDPTSRQALLFVARRTASESVGMVLATAAEGVDQRDCGVPTRRLTPLDAAASRAVLAQASPEPIAPAVADRLVATAAGVPLALAELPGVLTPAQLAGAASLSDPPPVGAGVRRAFGPRLAGLDPAARAALVVAAAAGNIGLAPTLGALAALDIPAGALESAEAGGVITLGGGGVAFRHPLLRAVAYHEAALAERRGVHRALAEVTPPVPRAWHLGRAALGPDEETAEELERTASAGSGQLSVSRAAQLMERAAELTDDDPLRARRCVRAAELWHLAGDANPAGDLLDRATRLTDDVRVRAYGQAVLARAESLRGRPNQAYRILVREAARVRATDPAAATVMLLDAADACCLAGEPQAALVAVRRACLMAGHIPVPLRDLCAVQHAAVLARGGLLPEARERLAACRTRLERFVTDGDVPAGWWRLLRVGLPALLTRLGETGAARRMVDEAVYRALTLAAHGLLPGLLAIRAELSMRAGDWDGAQAQAAEAVDLADEVGQVVDTAAALLLLARLAAARGDRARCGQHLARAREIVGDRRLGGLEVAVGAVEGLLELASGDHAAAYVRLERVVRRVDAGSLPDPGWVPWLPDFVEAAVAVGRREEAQRALSAARRQASGSLLLPAVVARCAALLAADASAAGAGALFADGLRSGPPGGQPFEQARTELCFGEWLTGQGRPAEAAARLAAAHAAFDALGARPWAGRARRGLDALPPAVSREAAEAAPSRVAPEALATTGYPPASAAAEHPLVRSAAGPRPAPAMPSRPAMPDRAALPSSAPRAPDRLTAQEHKVTMLVGQGATNREAASALFVSPKTIEFHLRSVYRKLGVRSRAELAHLIGQGHLTERAS